MKRTHLFILAAVALGIWWLMRRSSSSAPYYIRKPNADDPTPAPYWQYGSDGETVTGVGPLP